jgi:hypothetical protein
LSIVKIAISALNLEGSSKVPTLIIIDPGFLGDFVPIAVPHASQKYRSTGLSMSVLLKDFGSPLVN